MEARPVEPLGPRASEADGGEGLAEREGEEISLTAVVATFNSAAHVEDCLISIGRWLPGAQTIVVDNGSTDGTPENVGKRFPDVLVLAGHGNVGFGGACNLGARRASGDYLLFLNPDAELVEVDRQALLGQTRASRFGMLTGSLLDGGAPMPLLRRQSGRWLSELLGAHLLAILSPLAPRPRYVTKATGRGLYTASGAAFMVRAQEFRSLGGFDERFFMYYEDTDLTQRYRQQGFPLRASTALAIRHVGGTSAPVSRRNALSFLGWIEYLAKWRSPTVAGRAATVAKVSYSLVLALLRSLSILGGRRLRDKAEEIAAMVRHISAAGADGRDAEAPTRYPAATPIVRGRFRSFGPGARD